MKRKKSESNAFIDNSRNARFSQYGPRIGKIDFIDADGSVFVDFPGNPLGPLAASLALTKTDLLTLTAQRDNAVLIVFENNDLHSPIIVGLISEKAGAAAAIETQIDGPVDELEIDKKTLCLNAQEEIVLRCGHSQIILKKSGKIIIRGTDLMSRSSGSNRIRGAAVKIN